MLVTGGFMDSCLINQAVGGIIDYGQVMSCLSHYKAPHRKITRMLQCTDLIRVKKGLYVLGDEYRTEPLCLEFIANLIFGPSYVSQEYALQHYGMIPERVDMVTSMTTKRRKHFKTPLGAFQYAYLNNTRFTVGVDWLPIQKNISILIASPEKALADTVAKYRDVTTRRDMSDLLIEDMRVDENVLKNLDLNRLDKINECYRHPVVNLLLKTLLRDL